MISYNEMRSCSLLVRKRYELSHGGANGNGCTSGASLELVSVVVVVVVLPVGLAGRQVGRYRRASMLRHTLVVEARRRSRRDRHEQSGGRGNYYAIHRNWS